jgi:hypothetical protein
VKSYIIFIFKIIYDFTFVKDIGDELLDIQAQ